MSYSHIKSKNNVIVYVYMLWAKWQNKVFFNSINPDCQAGAALRLGKFILVAEAAERVECRNGEAMLLPFRLQHPEAGGAAT